jgi:DNA-directed RNA polymerase specialized sigma24 family protein
MPECKRLLDELLGDPAFVTIVALVTKEVMSLWRVSHAEARGDVFAAIGEPNALAQIHDAWTQAREGRATLGLAKVIVRRRVIDLLRRKQRKADHRSLQAKTEDDASTAVGSANDQLALTPRLLLEYLQALRLAHGALDCFAKQGKRQQRQAALLRRRILDETSHADLSTELKCSRAALAVRIHKALRALRKHVRDCHPELLRMWPIASVEV